MEGICPEKASNQEIYNSRVIY